MRSSDADGYLVRNYDHLRFFAGERGLVGDFSLNVANPLAAQYFMERTADWTGLTTSYDLNATQLESLLRAAPPEWFEVTIHQHMPMFHMEHCVFCAFLSDGTDYRNCGRPCDRQTVRLRDRVGLEHPLKADAGCRNTVFNARAQTGAESVERLRALGSAAFSPGVRAGDTPRRGDDGAGALPRVAARGDQRRGVVARAEIKQPTRRHARADGARGPAESVTARPAGV